MIFSYHNVRVFPYKKHWVGGVDYLGRSEGLRIARGEGEDRRYIDEFSDFNVEKTGSSSLRHIKGRYLYGGPFYKHFGHFMTDTIIRLHGYNSGSHDGVIFPCYIKGFNGVVPEYVYEVLEVFGIERDKAVFVQTPSVVDCLDLVDRSSNLSSSCYESWYVPLLKEIKKRISNYSSYAVNQYSNKKLYLGRSHLANQATVLGETYISSLLMRNGFEYFCPEDFTVTEQAKILMDASCVVFVEGSSIYSTELVDSLTPPCFMISRRGNGRKNFRRQLSKFSSYKCSSPSNLVRIKNNNNGYASTSPSYIKNLDLFFSEICGFLSIDKEEVSIDEFLKCEFSDAVSYYDSREILYESLADLCSTRINVEAIS